ncbi:MAG: hypothetical protein JSW11_21640 [Candidatus Heimdallarchaeota archaeon]|nr:MAG: hypothetical protein JSW11_21640 [Candidatus Heimdallarchaeota archaeon]
MQNSNRSLLHHCYSHLFTIIDDLGSLKYLIPFFLLVHFTLALFIPPLVTSDFERNLFYGKYFWEYGFSVYDMTPLEIDPLYNVRDTLTGEYSYPNTTYDYPTIQLLFWAGLSILPFSSVIAKWFLSCVDVFNFFVIYSLIRSRKGEENECTLSEKGFAFSYLLLSIPFSAIEGQATAITILFLLLPLFLYNRYQIVSYLSIGIGFHWKYVSVLVLPYLLILDRKLVKQALLGFLTSIFSIVLLSFPLLYSSFILRYLSSFGNLGEYSGQLPSNPFFIFYPSISSVLSSGILILAVIFWVGYLPKDKTMKRSFNGILERIYWLPFILLLIFLKIYSTAFPWYWMWFFACLTILPCQDRKLFMILLGFTFTIGLIDFIQMTVGIPVFLEFFM